MRNSILITAIIVFGIVALGFDAVAAPQTAKTIQECTALLPKGKSYTYTIKGTIDTTGAKPSMHGSFTVSEVKAKSVAIGATDTEKFAGCVKALIKRKSF